MFAANVSDEWIKRTLAHCSEFPDNRYLFQSKNPKKMRRPGFKFPNGSIFGTTIESNRDYPRFSTAPSVKERAYWLCQFPKTSKVMVTIEPVLDFDVDELATFIELIRPGWVNIGADSKGHGLPEPSKDKVFALIERLIHVTHVREKPNLKRLLH